MRRRQKKAPTESNLIESGGSVSLAGGAAVKIKQIKGEDKNMSQITVTINAPELVSVLRTLAESISGKSIPALTSVPVQQPMQQPVQAQPAQINPMPAAPVTPPPAVPSAPVTTPATPVQQPGFDPVTGAGGTVPTTAQTYTLTQLAVAATQLVDTGRRGELVNLLASFGVPALTGLPKEHYGAFATQLRAMGAKI